MTSNGTAGRGADSTSTAPPGASAFNPDLLAGIAIVAFGIWFLWQASLLREGPGYAAVGPRVFPVIVGIGLLLSGLGITLVAAATVRRARMGAAAQVATEEDVEPTDW